nr:unnamed protein product [Callosobruchus chinensis]
MPPDRMSGVVDTEIPYIIVYLSDRSDWALGEPQQMSNGITWYTDGSKTSSVRTCRNWGLVWKILCAGSAGRQLKLRNTSSLIILPCAEEEARIWKLSRRREDRDRKYFSPSNLLMLYKAQIISSLEYCSHIWGATALSILDAVQRRAI